MQSRDLREWKQLQFERNELASKRAGSTRFGLPNTDTTTTARLRGVEEKQKKKAEEITQTADVAKRMYRRMVRRGKASSGRAASMAVTLGSAADVLNTLVLNFDELKRDVSPQVMAEPAAAENNSSKSEVDWSYDDRDENGQCPNGHLLAEG